MQSTLAGSLILGRFHWALSAVFFPACICLIPCLIGAWNLCTTRKRWEVWLKFPPDDAVSVKALNTHEDVVLLSLLFGLRKRSSLTFDDNEPTRSGKPTGQTTCEWKRNPFCPDPEWDLIDTIHLQCRPPRALAKDICNWCQGPINHPVSKRPCSAFYISTYVESERVCHRCEPLSEKKVFWRPFPL